jgi:hypothetical protein
MAISAGVEGTFRLGDVFSKAFSVFSRHIIAFFLVAVLANLPAYIVGAAVAQLAAPRPEDFTPFGLLITDASAPVTMICWAIANGAMTYGVIQDLRGRTMSIAQASAIAARRFLPLIGIAIVVGLLFWLGFGPLSAITALTIARLTINHTIEIRAAAPASEMLVAALRIAQLPVGSTPVAAVAAGR